MLFWHIEPLNPGGHMHVNLNISKIKYLKNFNKNFISKPYLFHQNIGHYFDMVMIDTRLYFSNNFCQ
jgi:hypothetical protein